MPIGAILFDKDGTLVDIQLTLGPATCDVLSRLSGGEPAMFARLAELTRVDAGTRRLMPGCPVISTERRTTVDFDNRTVSSDRGGLTHSVVANRASASSSRRVFPIQ